MVDTQMNLVSDGSQSFSATARAALYFALLMAACVFSGILVGTRSMDVGTDTRTYAQFFISLGRGPVVTRLEPGFVFLTRSLRALGLSVYGYQLVVYLMLIISAFLACKDYFSHLERRRNFLGFLMVSAALLFASPVFVNASINTVRQGLASFMVFAALLSFLHRRWMRFLILGALATSFHYSSVLFLFFAPALFLRVKMLRIIAIIAFTVYCTGISRAFVSEFLPPLYSMVMDYSANATFNAGIRIDFAVFSIFWYLLPYVVGRLVEHEYIDRIKEGGSVYLVLLLPFFMIGWGNFSNRYLLPAWLSASLTVAALLFSSRVPVFRNPIVVTAALVCSCGLYFYYVKHLIVI